MANVRLLWQHSAECRGATDLGDLCGGGQPRTYCERCAREHLRSIESKLDSEWW